MLEPAPSAEPAPPQAVEDEEATSEALEETPKTQEELGEEEFEENEAEREVYNKDQETKVEEYKKDDDYHSSMPGGFIGVMKGKLVDVVKDVQDTEGSLHQADNFINGDAAVNTFFANALSKAKTDEEKQKVNTHADTVYRGAFKGKVMNKKKKELLS
jgi:hypoxanthine phosphoribosyltransferase